MPAGTMPAGTKPAGTKPAGTKPAGTMPARKEQKSLLLAYLCWILGGCFGLHLFYLRRDRQMFVYWWSLGGYLGLGIFRDLIRLPTYVRDANDENEYIKELTYKMSKRSKPSLSITRMVAQVMVGNMWYLLAYAAVPKEDTFYGFSLESLAILLSPAAAAAGVWMVGNIGRECGSFSWALIGSYAVLVAVPLMGVPVLNWCSVLGTVLFSKFSRKWRRTPYTKRSPLKRGAMLAIGWLFFASLVCSFLYFNATLESNNEKIKFRDAVGNFIRSPMFQEFKKNCYKVYSNVWEQGFTAAWISMIELLDPSGRQHALKVLNLPKNSSQSEIKDRVRELSRQWHPDKHQGDEMKRSAQEQFMMIQQAGDVLLDSKRKRNKKNKTPSNADQFT